MRARNIKPGFFENEDLAECNPLARILFAGLWCMADRTGRLENRPKRIKAKILPYDDCSIEGFLNQLEEKGFICRYQIEGKSYIQINKFSNHQHPHQKEAESEIPAPEEHQTSTVQAPEEHQTSTVQAPERHQKDRADSLIPDSLIPDSCTPSYEGVCSTSTDEELATSVPVMNSNSVPLEKIQKIWNQAISEHSSSLPRLKKIAPGTARYNHIRARWKSNPDLETWQIIADKAAKSVFMNGNNNRGWQGKFDWIVKNELNFTKVLEGNYDDKEGKSNGPDIEF